ncbi:MAG: 50S ribosomal protein L13 [Planctomycetota bacterium]|nr:MAG: 50S ribosomal protein L13 [Planctomycetota bacterium]
MRPTTSHRTSAQHARHWHVVDADGQVLGRLARDIAVVLMGKHRPTWSPHYDSGDAVVVVNCGKVRLTGRKAGTKVYARYTGYPGGYRTENFSAWIEQHPERVVHKAVQRMLPKTRLGRQMLRKLKLYPGPEHPHVAQKPAPLALTGSNA